MNMTPYQQMIYLKPDRFQVVKNKKEADCLISGLK